MEIRRDFTSVSEYLDRLVQYAAAFRKNNIEAWPHLKNNEDFDRVYRMDWNERRAFENVYSQGRDCAVALSDRLIRFNHPEENPTLTDFVESLQKGWLYQLDDLKKVTEEAKEVAASIESTPWAVEQMIVLYEDQLRLVDAARKTVDMLKKTRLYKLENGIESVDAEQDGQESETLKPWWKNFDRRIAVIGLIVAIAGLALSAGIL